MSEVVLQERAHYPAIDELGLPPCAQFSEVFSETNYHRILTGASHGEKAFLKMPAEPMESPFPQGNYEGIIYRNHAAWRELMSLCTLSESPLKMSAPYRIMNVLEGGFTHALHGRGFWISSCIPGITLSGDMIRNLSVAEQRDIGARLAEGVTWFSRTYPHREFARILYEAPHGYRTVEQRLLKDLRWNKRLSAMYDAGYEWLTDEILRSAERYAALPQTARPKESFMGHSNLFTDNVLCVKPEGRWRVSGPTGYSRVGPSSAERELAFIAGFGEQALISAIERYEALTGVQVNQRGLEYWIRAHLLESCAKTVLTGNRLHLVQRETLKRWIPEGKWSRLPEAAEDELLSLRDIRALCPPLAPVADEVLGTSRGDEWTAYNDSVKTSIERADTLGAAVVKLFDARDYELELESQSPQTFVTHYHSIMDAQRARIEAAFFNGAGRDILRPAVESLVACNQTELFARLRTGKPFVLAYPAAHRGNCKYLIEEPWQLDRLLQFCADFPDQNWLNVLEVRQFIKTPSDEHYTSYRSMFTATGQLLAASLSSSGHTKSSGRVVEHDRTEQSHGQARLLKLALEDSASPYFLAARDIRSNADSKRDIIALDGPAARRPVSAEIAELLQLHRIDPENRTLPADVEREGRLVARGLGPFLDTMLGIDHIPGRDNRKWLGEWNVEPLTRTYVACGYGNNVLRALTEARLQAIESLSYGRSCDLI